MHEEMDDRGIACFDQALEDVGLGTEEPLRWSWDGLQT